MRDTPLRGYSGNPESNQGPSDGCIEFYSQMLCHWATAGLIIQLQITLFIHCITYVSLIQQGIGMKDSKIMIDERNKKSSCTAYDSHASDSFLIIDHIADDVSNSPLNAWN